MKRGIIILSILALAIILSGCAQQTFCKSPYIEYQKGQCCLDSNNNKICDKDETSPSINKSIEIETKTPSYAYDNPSKDLNVNIYYGDSEGKVAGVIDTYIESPVNYYLWVINNENFSIKCQIINLGGNNFFYGDTFEIEAKERYNKTQYFKNPESGSIAIKTGLLDVQDKQIVCNASNKSVSKTPKIEFYSWWAEYETIVYSSSKIPGAGNKTNPTLTEFKIGNYTYIKKIFLYNLSLSDITKQKCSFTITQLKLDNNKSIISQTIEYLKLGINESGSVFNGEIRIGVSNAINNRCSFVLINGTNSSFVENYRLFA